MPPTENYLTMLEIKLIIKKWQNLELTDRQALTEIDKIIIAKQKKEWNDNHK